jgi:hypothetical protein
MGGGRLLYNRQTVTATAAYHGRGCEPLTYASIWAPICLVSEDLAYV